MQRLFLFETTETTLRTKKDGALLDRETSEKIENISAGLALLAETLKSAFPHSHQFGIIGFIENTIREHAKSSKLPQKIASSPRIFDYFHFRSPELLFALRCYIELCDTPHSELKSAKGLAENILLVCDKTKTEFGRAEEMRVLMREFTQNNHSMKKKVGI